MHVGADYQEEVATSAVGDVTIYRCSDTKCVSVLTLCLHFLLQNKDILLILLNFLFPSLPPASPITPCGRHVCRSVSKGSLRVPTDSCVYGGAELR